jgi:hypothetical protein
MKPPKHAHVFQTNKTTLSIPGINRHAMLDTLGVQLKLSTIVDGVLDNWTHHFHCNWYNFAHLTILLFHSNAGKQVNNTSDANDSAILLPVVNGPLGNCHKQVHFIQVQLNLNFASLVPHGIQALTILRVEFYIKLPQSSRNMMNGNNQPHCLTSWLGNADLCTITAANFTCDVLAHTLQDRPINLLCPDYNLTSAKTYLTTMVAEISSKIIHLATPSVLDTLFNQLCPGYSKEPHTALDHIQQTYNNRNSNTVFLSVYDYYTQIFAASCPFIDMEVLPVSIFQAFIDDLDHCLLAGFCTHFPDYSKSPDCAAAHQRTVLQDMLQAALCAKTEYNNIRAIALEASGFGSQAFSAQVNTSQAEKTISRYSNNNSSRKSGSSSKGPLCCCGCGGPHPWSLLKNRIHVIKCSNANNPGIHENAKKVIKHIHSNQKKKQQDFTKRKNLATANFSDFDAKGQEHICHQVFNCPSKTASVPSLITAMTGGTLATSPAKSAIGKHVMFLYNAQALNTNIHHPMLPVSIQLIMPHINLHLSTNMNNSSSPIVCCVVNTAAALCTGNYHFFPAIAKQYPQCVAKIFLPEDYSPIILSGIVQDNAEPITTDLHVAFQFHPPYFTKDGSATSFVVATVPQVSVNTVLGLPLISTTGMILDFVDNVVQANYLDCPLFKIEFCGAMKTVRAPQDDEAPTTHYIKFEDVQRILQKTNTFITGVCECLQLVPASTVYPSSATALARVCFQADRRSSGSDLGTVTTSTLSTNRSIGQRWVPPPSAHNTTTEYHDHVLGEARYLLVPTPP